MRVIVLVLDNGIDSVVWSSEELVSIVTASIRGQKSGRNASQAF
jgi:hypothetical protein